MKIGSCELASEWVPASSGKIYTRLGGRESHGPPVLLVHGFVLASEYMLPAARVLAPLCRVYAIDFPGFGLSDKPRRDLGLGDLAAYLGEWMDALKLRQIKVIGNSFGCQIIAEFAARYGTRVERIVFQGPTVDPAARTVAKQLVRLVRNSRVESPGLGRVMLRDYWRAGLRRIISTARAALTDRLESKLPHIAAPSLVVRGERDPLVPQEWAERVAALLPKGELLVMPDLGHTINYTAPVQFIRAIQPFLGL
jgi:2-hydroxy-6-oxonona-2,4-dienedioate hydrolase